ncbi:hypothetical protein [Microvirga massiliensis]|uniref:hypothetical protein n=1 Tax=Microvirga massiliensis TaxID=1033741 RepID=UPI000A409D51|nr:hypothetical protein [Microvirga massiliensis]
MRKRSRRPATAPSLQCHASIAAALGAVLLRHPDEAQRFGVACIPVRGHDGSCWIWPLEASFVDAIQRR